MSNVLSLYLSLMLVLLSLGNIGGFTTSPVVPETETETETETEIVTDGKLSLDTSSWATYENLACDYSVRIPTDVEMLTDEEVSQLTAGDGEDGEDEVYDSRMWRGEGFILLIQIKEPTYSSFEEEVKRAPEYDSLMGDQFTPEQNFHTLHDGELRDTPAGTMLECAYEYTNAGNVIRTLYYDYYHDAEREFIFMMQALGAPIEDIRAMVDAIVGTFVAPKGKTLSFSDDLWSFDQDGDAPDDAASDETPAVGDAVLDGTAFECAAGGYRVTLPKDAQALGDEQISAMYDLSGEGENALYDVRVWQTSTYNIIIQTKKPTYSSFEEECEKAADYEELVAGDYAAMGYLNFHTLHDGVLRDVKPGRMLEYAYAYDVPSGFSLTGNAWKTVTCVYYDFYYDADTEYIILAEGYEDEDTLRQVVNTMADTFEVLPVTL